MDNKSKKIMKMEDELNNIEVEKDSGNIYGKKDDSFKGLVLNQYKKCLEEGSKEMTRGGVISRFINGELMEYVASDQVQIYVNCINSLRDTLTDMIFKHETFMKPKIKSFKESIKTIQKKRAVRLKKLSDIYVKTSWNRNPDGYSSRNKIIPLIRKQKKVIKDSYDKEMVSIYRNKLLGSLTSLIGKLNYFEES